PLENGINALTLSAIDEAGNQAQQAEAISVKRTVLLTRPADIVIDNINNQALVIDPNAKALVAVDLITGARSLVSNNRRPNNTNPFFNPTALALDTDNNRALI